MMKTLLLSVLIALPLFVLSQSSGSIKALEKVTIYGDNSEIVLTEGMVLPYNLSNGKVVIVHQGQTLIKSPEYLDKLAKKGKIEFVEKAVAKQVESEQTPAVASDDDKTQRKLNIILGHLVVGDIALIVSIIRLINASN